MFNKIYKTFLKKWKIMHLFFIEKKKFVDMIMNKFNTSSLSMEYLDSKKGLKNVN